MKKLINILLAASVLIALNACQDEIDIDKLTDFAPGIASVYPADGGKIVKGDFDIKVKVADGTSSTLAEITVTLLDADGNELYTASKDISGTMDSIIIEAADFEASSLDVGSYSLHIVATDVKSQVNDVTTTFDISKLPYAASNDAMYISGNFNGWGSDAMELVADYTWELQNVEMDGGEWKFKNTTDWSDTDWGDSDCDGVMEITSGGGANTNCGYTGLVNIRFNDNTLQYTIEAAVTLELNLSSLYLLGSFNDFQGTDYAFTASEDHIWELGEIELTGGDSFRFSEGPYGGTSFGDSDNDGIAEESAPNIVLADDFKNAIYSVTFNDESLEYSFTFVRNLFPSELYLVGGSTSAGWDPASAIQFVSTGEGYFEMYAYLTISGDGFKFLQERDWSGDWGADPSVSGALNQDSENNVTVSEDGFYRINVNFIDGTYSVTKSDWGVIGSATPGGWDSDTDMSLVSATPGNYSWTVEITLTDGAIKFRENDGWSVNYGDNGANGSLESGGSDIAVSAGTYTVTMTLDPINGYTYTIE